MKRYLATFGLLAFTGALLSLQASTIQSYAANSKAAIISNADHFRQDTTPRSDTSMKQKKGKYKNKTKTDTSGSRPQRDSMPR
jgi:hypothetical protein